MSIFYKSLETFEDMGFCTNYNLIGIMLLEKKSTIGNIYYILDEDYKRLKKVDFGFLHPLIKNENMEITYKKEQVKRIEDEQP